MLVLKQTTGFNYEQLAFVLEDSSSYRRFCMLGIALSADLRLLARRSTQ